MCARLAEKFSWTRNSLVVLRKFFSFTAHLYLMKRIHFIISGDVVGVGFRAWALRQAQGKHLTGWVKNIQDKKVEIVAEGKRIDLEELIKRCRHGPELAVVKTIDVQWKEATGEFMSFEVIY